MVQFIYVYTIFIFKLLSNCFIVVVSMFELSSVRQTGVHQPFKHVKFTSVEFVAEFIQVVLKELWLDVVV